MRKRKARKRKTRKRGTEALLLQSCSSESPWALKGADGPAMEPMIPSSPSERERDPRIWDMEVEADAVSFRCQGFAVSETAAVAFSKGDHGFDTDVASLG